MSALLTVPEAAAALRCSPRRVFQLLADGTLKRGAKYGRHTVVTRESVEAAQMPPEPTAPRKRYRPVKSLEEGFDEVLAKFKGKK